MKSVAVTILILSLYFPAFTQDRSDNDLALQYFRDKDYEKAAELYGSLYEKSLNKTYYMYYILCLTELKRYDDAEKVIKRQTRKYPDDLSYIVDLGYIYKQQGKTDDGESEYDKALKKMLPSQNSIIGLANAFIAKRELKRAEETYITGKKLMRGDYTFSYELASVYRYQRNFQKMIDEYLDLLLINENYIQSVQNSLQATIYSEDQEDLTNILKNSLISRIQKYPQVTIFNELLIWLYLQDKDFENAFYQSKALDKRNNEQGYRILTLGDLAVENRMWDIAVKCFRYVIDLGENGILYLEGKYSYLDALYKKIKATGEFTPQEISDLEQNYIATLDELGRNAKTVGLVIELAHIRAFYMSKMDEAIQMLEEALLIPGINQSQISQCKLELGDIFIFS
ncbi:MAG: tetratricopeptide repeat protein, partial [Bacteroidota bacterium]